MPSARLAYDIVLLPQPTYLAPVANYPTFSNSNRAGSTPAQYNPTYQAITSHISAAGTTANASNTTQSTIHWSARELNTEQGLSV
jgi:hypothetical protein